MLMSKPRKRQAPLSQSVTDEKSYGLRKSFLQRETCRCTEYLDGAISEDTFEASWNAAIRWRTREFDYAEYNGSVHDLGVPEGRLSVPNVVQTQSC